MTGKGGGVDRVNRLGISCFKFSALKLERVNVVGKNELCLLPHREVFLLIRPTFVFIEQEEGLLGP